jgi:DNA mismatch endonuclease (patch repair protein)
MESRAFLEFCDSIRTAPAIGSRMEAGALTDIMSPEKRSALMSRIKGKHTGPERTLRSALRKAGYRPIMHDRRLPGRPDFVFCRARIAVFVDGDFWHGWHFDRWREKLTPAWEAKIAANIARDKRNFRKLRACGWSVVRIWEHQIEADLDQCVERIAVLVDARRTNRPAR